MMDEEVPKPKRVGVTTLSKLMTGEDVCHLRPWYEKKHPNEAPPPGPELVKWQMNHTEVVTKLVMSLKGGEVERETWLSMDQPPVIGKADVIHQLPGGFHIYEAKSGRKANSHGLQLLIYLHIARKTLVGAGGPKLYGHLVYPDQQVDMGEDGIPLNLERMMTPHIEAILSPDAPRAVKSSGCRFCWADCPYAQNRAHVKKESGQ
jgi:hypothetical protein